MLPAAVLAVAFLATPPPAVQLARLADLYRAYDLPVPPKDAKLVRHAPDGKAFPMPARVGFEVSPPKDAEAARVLFGCEVEAVVPWWTADARPDPKAVTASEVSLATAIQFHLRGWRELALAVFTENGDWEDRVPEVWLAVLATRYWQRQLCDPAADRAKVARRLGALRNAQPSATTDADRAFHDDLLRSLKVSKAKPGTVEADIDELIDVSGWHHAGAFPLPDPRYTAVVARGFDAVPALLDHLTDDRLTRVRRNSLGNKGWERADRVKNFASDILAGYMFDDPTTGKTDEAGVIRVNEAKAWWAKQAKTNEAEYAVGRVLTAHKQADLPNPFLLLLLERKYPKRLPEVFRSLLADRPKMQLGDVADAVADSALPTETKRALFKEAADAENAEWQKVGRDRLKALDEKK